MMNAKEKQQYEKLVLTPIPQLIPALAAPTVVSMMITQIYNLADAFFVGKLGTSASAAIGILLSLQAVFQAIGFMFGHGSGSMISRFLGQGDKKSADQTVALGFTSAFAVSFAAALLGLLFLTPLMKLLGSTDTILPYAASYGRYILIAGPAMTLACMLNNVIRYEGKAFFAMIGLVSGGVLNMILDPILIFGCGMGIRGAGLATAISQYISMGLLLYMFLSRKTVCELSLRHLRPDGARLCSILKNGFPSLVRQMLNSVSNLTLNLCAVPYGDAAIAAMSIVGRLVFFIASAMIGIGQGFQPVSAYNYAAEKYRRVRDAIRFTTIASAVVLTLLAAVMFCFPETLVRIFRDDAAVIAIGKTALRFQCIGLMVQPLSVVANMLFQSIGKSRLASICASLRTGVYYIPALLILPHFFGIYGIESAQMVADILATVTSAILLLRFLRTMPEEDRDSQVDRNYLASCEASDTPADSSERN